MISLDSHSRHPIASFATGLVYPRYLVGEAHMAKMTIDKGYFSDKAEVMDDIRRTGYWPNTVSYTHLTLPTICSV